MIVWEIVEIFRGNYFSEHIKLVIPILKAIERYNLTIQEIEVLHFY